MQSCYPQGSVCLVHRTSLWQGSASATCESAKWPRSGEGTFMSCCSSESSTDVLQGKNPTKRKDVSQQSGAAPLRCPTALSSSSQLREAENFLRLLKSTLAGGCVVKEPAVSRSPRRRAVCGSRPRRQIFLSCPEVKPLGFPCSGGAWQSLPGVQPTQPCGSCASCWWVGSACPALPRGLLWRGAIPGSASSSGCSGREQGPGSAGRVPQKPSGLLERALGP